MALESIFESEYKYGDRENQDLAFQFDISEEDYPVYKLFNRTPTPDSAIPYEGTDKVSLNKF